MPSRSSILGLIDMQYGYTIRYAINKGASPDSLAYEDEAVKKYLDDNHLRPWCESTLRQFPYVMWDRLICTKAENGPHMVTCYGWINREQDSYKDFVVVTLVLDTKAVVHSISSSAKYNDELSSKCAELSGYPNALNKQCVRVEDLFEIQNMVKLNGRKKQ